MKSAIVRCLPPTIIVLFLLIQLPASAQNMTPTPWSIDPNIVFEPGIEVTELPITVPQKTADNETRLITVQDKETKKFEQFPYPDEFKSVNSYNFDNEIVWLEVDEVSGIRWVWMLDTQTKLFTRYIARCMQKAPLYFRLDGLNLPWVLYEDQQTHRVYLCENATGKMSDPLPEDMSWLIGDPYWNKPTQPSTSPDGQWVALFAKNTKINAYKTFVYSYNVNNKELKQLGDFESEEIISFWNWVGTQLLISTRRMSDSYTPTSYIVDAARPHSLEFAMSESGSFLGYYDNPPRFEYVDGSIGYDFPYTCWWDVYMVESRQLITHSLGTMCQPEIGKLTEDAYYRDIPNNTDGRPQIATLVRYNAITEQRKELYSGEIESIEWVSEDEHYAIMTLGTNGVIDNTHEIIDPSFLNLDTSANLSYVDLVNKKVLFDVHAYWENYSESNWRSLKSSIRKLAQNTFLAIGYTSEQEGVASLFTFDGTKYVEKQIADHAALNIGHYLLRWTDGYQKSTRMSLYDIDTGKETPVIRNIDTSQYHIDVSATSASPDHFVVFISNIPNTGYLLTRYEVKIPLN